MQLEPSLLRHHLVYLTSLPSEMLRDKFNELVIQFSDHLRDEAMISAHNECEWGRIVLENDSEDLSF